MEEVYEKIFVSGNYFNRARSKSFKVKKMKYPSIFYNNNKSTTDNKHSSICYEQ
jgi:hypothetical protein